MSRKVSTDLERSPVGVGIRKVGQWVSLADFTDAGGAVGTKTLAKQIPAGSFVFGSKVKVTEGFIGDVSAVLDIGDGSDADLFSLTTHNVFAAASNLVEGADAAADASYRGFVAISSDTTITLTVTVNNDWGDVTAGKMFVEVLYFSTNVEVVDKTQTIYDARN
ncbi:hypothetical protein LCGC14_1588420 [marine sediment metagenome]|uniref:Uncharacterized protein n=1 Tax=marine sediment metagenome TaxID=412755 RepID=A0A0F9IER7_9ZZZZ|nr:hypothetical protein [Pricia sp.]